jgi:cytochrome c peroxidase
MNKVIVFIFCFLSILLLSVKDAQNFVDYPNYWPQPYIDLSQLKQQEIELGRNLFYDPILSEDSSISCSSCHLQATGFTHIDHNVSHGIYGRKGTRNAPSLQNLAWNKTFHWDGGVSHLSGQAVNPITHTAEMNFTMKGVLNRLNRSEKYKRLLKDFSKEKNYTSSRLLLSLAQFTASLVSCQSKYDEMKAGKIIFTEQEEKGYQLFKQNCVACHTEPLFMHNEYTSNGIPIDSTLKDLGRFSITHKNSDSLKFKIPSLRNCEVTFPYMHDGRFKKLKEVINHYTNESLVHSNYLDKRLKRSIKLSEMDKKDLLSFLLTLTDRKFLTNKQYSFPK